MSRSLQRLPMRLWVLGVVVALIALLAGGGWASQSTSRLGRSLAGATGGITTAGGPPATGGNPTAGSPTTGGTPTGGGSPNTDPTPTRPNSGLGSGSGGTIANGGLGSSSAAAAPVYLGPANPGEPIEVSLVLRMPGDADIAAYLNGLYDPASPNYRRFLSPAQFGARFGLPLDRIGAVEAWATANGLVVTAPNEQRTALRVSGTIGQVDRLFKVSFGSYSDPPTGATFHAPLGAATVPAAIAGDVDGIAGLSNEPMRTGTTPASGRPVTAADNLPAAAATQGFGPLDLAEAYDIVPMYKANLFGQGQTVAIVSFDTYHPEDITAFDKQFGITGPPVQRIAVGPKITAPGDGSEEVTLDIDVLRSVAPQAQILNFEAKNGGNVGFADIFDAIVQDGRADIVTVSWGRCDIPQAVTTADRTRTLRSLQAATAKGVSIFNASGDWGAFTCWVWDPSDQRQSLYWPSDSPYTIAVGGTRLHVRNDGSYYQEAGWEDYLSTGGTGGGLSAVDAIPPWQTGPGVTNEYSNGKRQTPDVSAAADPDTGYLVYRTPPDGGDPDWTVIGGTSGASPFWAGIMLLTRQLAMGEGVGPLGYVNPMLYALAASATPNTIFHDVTVGGNLFHHATPGWDFATGLGTPDVTALAVAIVNYLGTHPAK